MGFAAGAPRMWISHIWLPKDVETGFLLFKERVPFKFGIKISAIQY
jgi:hypothetical protein